MVELVVCTLLLSVIAASVLPGIRAVQNQRKRTRYDALAQIELNNVAARLTAGFRTEDLKMTDAFTRQFPQADLSIEQAAPNDRGDVAVRIQIRRPDGELKPDLVRALVVWMKPGRSQNETI